MSRLRTIKPGFFFDDQLSECDPLARLLYAGMWTIADREGRLEDRPKRIKAECLPFDDCDVDVLLDQLERRGFITRYTAGEARYIAIPTWAKHQHPHVKEPASVIPAPDEYQLSMSLANVEPGSSCLVSCLGSCLGDSEQEEHLSTTATVPAAETYSPDFEQWWEAYGRHGSKADAAKLWKHWRKQASPEALLTAARNYVSDCMARDRLIRDGRTFLARDPNRWAEWIEPHPADVATDRRTVGNLTDVLDAGARAFGLIGDDHGIPGTGVADRPDGAVAGRADARRGLPSGELAAGQ